VASARQLALLMVTALLLLGCGARTGLLIDDGSPPGPDGDVDVDSDVDIDADADADADGDSDVDEPDPCVLRSSGEPVEIMVGDDRDCLTPSMVALSPSSVVLAAVISWSRSNTIELASVDVGGPWPEGVLRDRPTLIVTPYTLTYPQLSHAAGGSPDLVVVWDADRPQFRVVEVATWTAGATVDMAPDGSTPLVLAPGAGVGPFGVGHQGLGYGIAWRLSTGFAVSPAVGVLDEAGVLALGLHPVSAPRESPGLTPDMVWTGEAYVMVTAFGSCMEEEPLCVENSVVVTRLRPASGDAEDDSGIDLVASIAPVAGRPRGPVLVGDGGASPTTLLWHESEVAGGPALIRAVRLRSDGTPERAAVTVVEEARPETRLAAALHPAGLAISWVEEGDDGLSLGAPGRSLLLVRVVDDALTVIDSPPPLPITYYRSRGPRALVAIDQPRGVVATWSGRSTRFDLEVVYLARFTCAGDED